MLSEIYLNTRCHYTFKSPGYKDRSLYGIESNGSTLFESESGEGTLCGSESVVSKECKDNPCDQPTS